MPETTTPSPSQLLADALLRPQTLSEYVFDKRTGVPKWSWRLIAKQLAIDTDGKVDVSYQTLRSWFATADDTAA